MSAVAPSGMVTVISKPPSTRFQPEETLPYAVSSDALAKFNRLSGIGEIKMFS